jgi:hypothetical protein
MRHHTLRRGPLLNTSFGRCQTGLPIDETELQGEETQIS